MSKVGNKINQKYSFESCLRIKDTCGILGSFEYALIAMET